MNKQMFGIDCPGCGAQRAVFLVIHGEFKEALKMFPAIYTLLLLFVFLLFNLFLKFKNDWSIKIALILINAFIIVINYFLKISQTII